MSSCRHSFLLSVVIYLNRTDEWYSLDTSCETVTQQRGSYSLSKGNIHNAQGTRAYRVHGTLGFPVIYRIFGLYILPPSRFATEPPLSAVTHFSKAAATNRDKSGVKQPHGLRRFSYLYSWPPELLPLRLPTIHRLDVSLNSGVYNISLRIQRQCQTIFS